MSRPTLGPTQSPIKCVPELFAHSKRRLGMKLTTHLYLVLMLKNLWSHTSTPPYVFIAQCLIKDRDITRICPFVTELMILNK
jgi:hypothetical protein